MIHYVEVIYLQSGHYQKRKYIQYKDLEQADKVYRATIKKLTGEKTKALICLRGEKGLLKSERV